MTRYGIYSAFEGQLSFPLLFVGGFLRDMDGFYEIFALITLATVSVLVLKAFSFKGAPIVAALFMVGIFLKGGDRLASSISLFSSLPQDADEYVSVALRIVGIGYIGGISSDVCREVGEGGLARAASLCARLEIIALSLPYMERIVEKCFGLIGD